MSKYVLGISAFYHDSAAVIINDGNIIAAAQEERFTRKKHDASFPKKAIEYVLKEADISLQNVESVVFYDKPFLKFERLLETYVANVPWGFNSFRMAMPIWLREKLFLKDGLIKFLKEFDEKFNESRLFFSEHHFSHAASAFFPSPFDEAIVLTLDGVGEWSTTSIAHGKGNNLKILREIKFPHSLGLLYSAFTYYTGFKVNSGEYKLMGLAPYGDPKFTSMILDNLIDVKEDGSFRLDQSFFNYSRGLTMISKKFVKLFGEKVRDPAKDELTQFHMDVAASIQEVTELIILKITRYLRKEFKIKNLCLAGGVALNCVANGKILKDKKFDGIWVQPAAGDAGGALGAALGYWHVEKNNPRKLILGDSMRGSYLGPKFEQQDIEKSLTELKAKFKVLPYKEMINLTAKELSKGASVGWFQGRMEFGPRALGARSILGDPRSEEMQKRLNLDIKFRESFRPFAPSILFEDLEKWFDLNVESPYMLFVSEVIKSKQRIMTDSEKSLFGIDKLNIKRSSIPAITHVDYSARIQTVQKSTNEDYYNLINQFKELTGCPVLINTSFNVRGEPIVCTPYDAFNCFMGTDLSCLVLGNCFLYKDEQDKGLLRNYKDKFDLD